MCFSVSSCRCALLLLLLVLSGCDPTGQTQLEEEKEPHFLTGKNRERSMDFAGAVEAFDKALEVNPQSAAAHFELGWLSAEKENDPAAAIYHYERYLKLRPNAENSTLVGQRILICKQDLARQVSLGPINEKVQRDLEQLTAETKRLTEENKRLREDLDKWTAYARSLETLTNRASLPASLPLHTKPATSSPPVLAAASHLPAAPLTSSEPVRTTRPAPPATTSTRTYKVQPGETPATIARKHGIRLEALLAANPGLNPRRMKAGQTLNLPSQ